MARIFTEEYPEHPGWSPGQPDQPAKPEAPSFGRSDTPVSEKKATVAGEGTVLPPIYGLDIVGAKITSVVHWGNYWYVQLTWSLGENASFVEIRSGGKRVWAAEESLEIEIKGVEFTHYLGAKTQTVDTEYKAAFEAVYPEETFSDDLVFQYGEDSADKIGICYSIAKYPDNLGFLPFDARIYGLKLYDPREALHDLEDPSTWEYSSNPALCTGDFIRSVAYGMVSSVDDTSLEAAANFCDELVGGKKRRKLGLALVKRQDSSNWLETLRGYAGCYAVKRNGIYYLIPDTVSVDGEGEIIEDYSVDETLMIEGTFKLGTKDMSKVPTHIVIKYTDTSASEWAEKDSLPAYLTDDQGGSVLNQEIPRRESRISMPGIQRGTQAHREAIERLRYLNGSDLEASWDSFDEMIQGEVGDDIKLSHPLLGTGFEKDMRLTYAESLSPGRWRFKAEELQASRYSDYANVPPDTPDTGLPNPSTPPPVVAGLTVTERTDKIADGSYVTRLKVVWDKPDYPFVREYGVVITKKIGGEVVHSVVVADREYVSPGVEELDAVGDPIEYSLAVFVVSTIGLIGESATADHQIVGTTDVPIWPAGSTLTGYEVGGLVQLVWTTASDVDLWKYEVRYGSVGTYRVREDGTYEWDETAPATNDEWENGIVLDRVDSLRFLTKDVPVGTQVLTVKALDSRAQETEGYLRLVLEVTESADAYVADTHQFDLAVTSPELDSVLLHNVTMRTLRRTDLTTYYTTDMREAIEDLFPNVMNTYTNILATYHGTGANHLKVGDGTASELSVYHSTKLPYRSTRTYRTRIRVRKNSGSSGSPILYAGLIGFAANGDFVNTSGNNLCTDPHFHAASNEAVSSEDWIDYIGYTSGNGTTGVSGAYPTIGSPGKMYTGVVFFSPVLLVNEGASSTNITDVLELQIDAIDPSDESVIFNLVSLGFNDAAMANWTACGTSTSNITKLSDADGSLLVTETWDLSGAVAGDWITTLTWEELSSGVQDYLNLSLDNVDWIEYPALSAKTEARYAKFHWLGDTTGTMNVKVPTISLYASVVPREEQGDSTSLAIEKATSQSSSSYLWPPDHTSVNSSASGYTAKTWDVEFHTHATDVTTFQLAYKQGGGTNGFAVYIESGKLYVGMWQSSTVYYFEYSVDAGSFYHVTAVFNGATPDFKVALNGGIQATLTVGSSLAQHSDDINIAALIDASTSTDVIRKHTGGVVNVTTASTAQDFFLGRLFVVRQYNTAISDADIKEHGRGSYTSDSLIQWYDFEKADDEGWSSPADFPDDSASANDVVSANYAITLASYAMPDVIVTENEFISAQLVTVTPIGLYLRVPSVDNIIVDGTNASFCVYIFNSSGTPVANAYKWSFRGS